MWGIGCPFLELPESSDMRHKLAGRKLGRNSAHRRALLRNLVTSLLEHERLVTTLPKAKEIRPIAEKMITLGKRDTVHSRRQVHAFLLSDSITKKVFDTIAPRFSDRPGGYSRIVRLGPRVGDGADVAVIELLGSGLEVRRTKEAKGAKKEAKEGRAKEAKTTEEQEEGSEEKE